MIPAYGIDNLRIGVEIVVADDIPDSLHAFPVHFRIPGEKDSACNFVEILAAFSDGYQHHGNAVEAIDSFVARYQVLRTGNARKTTFDPADGSEHLRQYFPDERRVIHTRLRFGSGLSEIRSWSGCME